MGASNGAVTDKHIAVFAPASGSLPKCDNFLTDNLVIGSGDPEIMAEKAVNCTAEQIPDA